MGPIMHMGCPHGTQLILATCFTKAPIRLAHVWAVRGSHMGLVCVVPLFLGGLSVGGPELGTLLTGSFVDCSVGLKWAVHMGPRSFWPLV